MMAHTTGTSDDKNHKTMDTNEKKLDSDSGQRTVTADKPNLQEAARPHVAAEISTEQRTKHLHAATVTRAKPGRIANGKRRDAMKPGSRQISFCFSANAGKRRLHRKHASECINFLFGMLSDMLRMLRKRSSRWKNTLC